MRRILRSIYEDPLLASELKFKGGTAAMMFHGLPRFSTDLDFNMTSLEKQPLIYDRLLQIVSGHGNVVDAADKRFGPIVVLNYGAGERNLKIEVSNRVFDNHYENQQADSLLVPTMTRPDMLSHKLCAFNERRAARDVFDVWYFLSQGWEINENIIRERTGMTVKDFLEESKTHLQSVSTSTVMQEIGELLTPDLKNKIVSGDMTKELAGLVQDYIDYPQISTSEPMTHTRLLFADAHIFDDFRKNEIDPSAVQEKELRDIVEGNKISLINRKGVTIPIHVQPVEPKIIVNKTGKFNYQNPDGTLLLKRWVDRADPFVNGRAMVKLRGVEFEINANGIITRNLHQEWFGKGKSPKKD